MIYQLFKTQTFKTQTIVYVLNNFTVYSTFWLLLLFLFRLCSLLLSPSCGLSFAFPGFLAATMLTYIHATITLFYHFMLFSDLNKFPADTAPLCSRPSSSLQNESFYSSFYSFPIPLRHSCVALISQSALK